jgi:hypothetical protein
MKKIVRKSLVCGSPVNQANRHPRLLIAHSEEHTQTQSLIFNKVPEQYKKDTTKTNRHWMNAQNPPTTVLLTIPIDIEHRKSFL